MTLGCPTSDKVFRSNGQRSRSQVQKRVEGKRVAGVSLHVYLPTIKFYNKMLYKTQYMSNWMWRKESRVKSANPNWCAY